MRSNWDDLAGWWAAEVAADPAYGEQVLPLLARLLATCRGPFLDLGCGEGQAMRMLAANGAEVVGCDASPALLAMVGDVGRVVECILPDLAWAEAGSFGSAYAVLVLEHMEQLEPLFAEVARVVGSPGHFAVVLNHPAFTAPGAGPFVDVADGETLWRWGAYFSVGTTEEPAADQTVVFHHRPLGVLVGAAAAAGWSLEELIEEPVGEEAARRDHLLSGQRNIPRLLGIRWRR